MTLKENDEGEDPTGGPIIDIDDWEPGTVCDDGFPLNPVIHEDMRAKMSHPRRDTLLADMRANRGLSGRRNAPFVPSGRWCASYDTMTREQKEFYLSWRSGVLEGRYMDSDRGYLWLLLYETIESDIDPEHKMAVLKGLLEAYGQSSESIKDLILRICQDYALLTDQDPPWEEKGDYVEAQMILWVKLDLVPVGWVPLDLAKRFMDSSSFKYVTTDADYETAFNIALRALAAKTYEDTDMSLANFLGGWNRRIIRKLFSELSSDWGSCSFTIREIRPANYGGKMLSAALKTAIRCVNRPLGLRVPKHGTSVERSYLERMEAETNAWVQRMRRAERVEQIRREAASITLDVDAVRDAEADLAAIKDMVGTEEDEGKAKEPDTVALEPSESDPIDPWEAFVRTLSASQREYLSASLKSRGGDAARAFRTTMVRMEDEINVKAMDTMGDQVVEEGSVFEEYAEEMSRVLSTRPTDIVRNNDTTKEED